MKRQFSLLFVCLLCFGAAVSQFADSSTAAYLSSQAASATRPVILYAQWIGKNLDVEGTNFSDGATILVDGQGLKTFNAETFPSSFLVAKKAKKKVARNQAITLQVQNPDGEISDPFPFYSGFLLTLDDSGSVLHLNVGDRFLLFLPPHGEPPTVAWTVSICGSDPAAPDPTAMTRNMNDLPIVRSQGFFEAVHPGIVSIIGDAGALCPPAPRWQCEQSGANFGSFSLVVFVDK